ncbi:hypothetical protein Tco_0572407 [Tanacetum coccineum]
MSTSSLQAEKTVYTSLMLFSDTKLNVEKEERSLINTSFLDEYECSSFTLEGEGKDEKKRLDHLKQDQEILVIKMFSERKKVFRERKKCEKIRAKRSDFQQGMKRIYRQENPTVTTTEVDLIHHILYLMDMKYVVQTRLLSSKWMRPRNRTAPEMDVCLPSAFTKLIILKWKFAFLVLSSLIFEIKRVPTPEPVPPEKKLEWWFEQDIDEEEEGEEGEGGSEV